MIDFISGILKEKNPTRIVIEVNGMGYHVNVSLNTHAQLPDINAEVHLKTYLHVREDSMQLFGFISEYERDIFLGLISVSGVGPKLAQTILSGIEVDDLAWAISDGNIERLTSVSGVGKKTAERLVVELKEKFSVSGIIKEHQGRIPVKTEMSPVEQEALMALISLGYKKQSAEKALLRIRNNGDSLPVEELIKKALQGI